MSTRIKLRVQGLANSQIQSGAYALILAEENGPRRIPIIVGTAEAQSIAIALEHIVPPRPLTHDLFATFAQAFNVILKEVYIYKFEDGVFYSELEFSDGERSIKLDSRTSDAIAIALRVNCDIFTSEEIVKECGVVLEDTLSIPADEPEDDDNLLELEPDEIKDEAQLKKWLSLLDIQEINERLEDAIADENYEYAKMYKDEVAPSRRRGGHKQMIGEQVGFGLVSLLRGLLGIITILGIAYAMSYDRKRIDWKLVGGGLFMQIVFALAVLYVPFVGSLLEGCGKIFVKLMDFTDAGLTFLLGPYASKAAGFSFLLHSLPIVIFFSALVSMFYHWGIIQKVVGAFAWVLRKFMNISGSEGLVAAGNILWE